MQKRYVLNLPDLGMIPANSGNRAAASALAAEHNALLASALTELATRLPGVHLIQVDVNTVLRQAAEFMDTTTPALDVLFPPEMLPNDFRMSLCLFINPALCLDVPTFDVGPRYLFWDAAHPTTEAHRLLAEHLHDVLRSPY